MFQNEALKLIGSGNQKLSITDSQLRRKSPNKLREKKPLLGIFKTKLPRVDTVGNEVTSDLGGLKFESGHWPLLLGKTLFVCKRQKYRKNYLFVMQGKIASFLPLVKNFFYQ